MPARRRRRRPHPARLERRIVGVASAICGVGMASSIAVAARPEDDRNQVRTEAADQAPVTAPRLDPARTSTTSLPPFSLEGAPSTVASTESTVPPPASTAPSTTVRRFIPNPSPTEPQEPPPTEGPATTQGSGPAPTTTPPATTTVTIPAPTTTTPPTTTVTIPPTTVPEDTTTTTTTTTTILISDGS